MSWSILVMLFNPLLLIIGLAVLYVLKHRPEAEAGSLLTTLTNVVEEEEEEDDEDGEGGIWVDWDAPLDLPPGVYAPSDPINIPA